jgi:hypothetical protein
MARVIGRDDGQARDLLAASGVTLTTVADDGDAPASLVEAVLPADARQLRGDVEIPVPVDPDAGMGAWHVNAVDEVHVVASGEGIMEFITIEGPVAVLLTAGDVLAIQGAEHRYRPLTAQRWLLRYGGPPEADLVATDTGRASDAWPNPVA